MAGTASVEERTINGLAGATALLLLVYNIVWMLAPDYKRAAAYPLAAVGGVTLYYIGLLWQSKSLTNDTRRTMRATVMGAWFLTILMTIGAVLRPTIPHTTTALSMALLDMLYPLGLMIAKRKGRA